MTAGTGSLPDGAILVTGASGFVGRYLLDELLRVGYPRDQVFALSRSSKRSFPDGIRRIAGDLTDRASVDAAIRDVQPTGVVHLAAIAEPARAAASPDEAWRINFDSVRFLAESLLAHSVTTRLVFAGSAEAYGASFLETAAPIEETAPLRPTSTYGATKAAADILLGQMAYQGLRAIRFRAFNHTGPGQSPAYVVASFAGQVAEIEAGLREPHIDVGNLESRRDFLDVRDVVRAYVLALSADLDFAAAPVFNICSGNARRVGDILEQLLTLSSARIDIRVDPARLRPSEVRSACGSSAAAMQRLGWKQHIDFDRTLVDILAHCRAVIQSSKSRA